MRMPRIVLAAAASGSGKTTVTCGILKALANRGIAVASFKCGPDYIDPLFHARMIGTRSGNLDLFFTNGKTARRLFRKTAAQVQISVIEGVMGYYDGLGMTVRASTYDMAKELDAPVVLIVDCRGMSLSIVPVIKGFLEYKENSHIRGVILNRISASLYERLKPVIEEELPVRVLGYLPYNREIALESRHLGLVTPDDAADTGEKLDRLAKLCEETVRMDDLIRLAEEASDMEDEEEEPYGLNGIQTQNGSRVRIAVSRDEAFCFWYEENLRLLSELGAEPVEFSPLRDPKLPEGAAGLWLCGGYPELHAKALSRNESMRSSIRQAVCSGMPCIAECGGFLYLQERLMGEDGNWYPMAGALKGDGYRAGRLTRFGYAEITANRRCLFGDKGTKLPIHEFHHWDSTENGDLFTAGKVSQNMRWECVRGGESLYAGFPHLYLYADPAAASAYVNRCRSYQNLHWIGE